MASMAGIFFGVRKVGRCRRGRRTAWAGWLSVLLGTLAFLIGASGLALGVDEGDWLGLAGGVLILGFSGVLIWESVRGLISRSG